MANIYRSATELVGKTPLLELRIDLINFLLIDIGATRLQDHPMVLFFLRLFRSDGCDFIFCFYILVLCGYGSARQTQH